MYEFDKHDAMPLYEWLLEFAKKHEIEGGSAFRAIAGFGRQKQMHEEHFFELGSNVPIKVSFILQSENAHAFLALLKLHKINLFYDCYEVHYGSTEES